MSSATEQITFDSFERFILKSMVDHVYDPDDSVTLRGAFEVFDKDLQGYIHVSLMVELGMVNVARFIIDDRFMYRKYIAHVSRRHEI